MNIVILDEHSPLCRNCFFAKNYAKNYAESY